MAIMIKRYRVRCNGVVYGPGQPGGTVIKGLSEEEETRLIAGSRGTIIRYIPESEPAVVEPAAEPATEKIEDISEKDMAVNDEEETTEEITSEESESVISAGDIINTNLDDLIKPAGGNPKQQIGKKRGGR